MSAVTTPLTTVPWPADVQDFAARQQVDGYLGPLLEATRGIFPTATSIRVLLEGDPEIRDDWHIVFEVRVPGRDVPHSLKAQHWWIDELYRICPAPRVCTFRLGLILGS
jgi:hypothetical protein